MLWLQRNPKAALDANCFAISVNRLQLNCLNSCEHYTEHFDLQLRFIMSHHGNSCTQLIIKDSCLMQKSTRIYSVSVI